ncbi:hypothetical protein Gohar_019588 [Gossypium harknessii]|uniref:DUF4283 domain-containing protein n=1 Tax=Gossypium harknessii TaxID=34285 RepID=A0A7J9IBV9_9ROSI|nr:hypothetical protein [Gossypium harknessii]
MAMDLEPESLLSWNHRLLGGLGVRDPVQLWRCRRNLIVRRGYHKIHGEWNPYFFERVDQLLMKDVATMVVIKLLGPWIIYEQYLTVQHWSPNFNPMKPYSGVVKAWIKFPGLSDFLYKQRILEETEGTIGKMLINGTIQRVEFESLSMVRFSCGRYGHVRKMCPKKATETSQSEVEVLTVAKENSVGDLVAYGPWMVINRKSRWSSRPDCS